jgi:hypothetical protein
MRKTPMAALLGAVVTAFLVSMPLELSAQATKSKAKGPPKATSTTTATKDSKNGTVEINSFSQAAANPVDPGTGTGGGGGKATLTPPVITKNDQPSQIYKGPIVVPPSAPQPNDSAHQHPPH